MPERTSLHISTIRGRVLWRLKSWLPAHASGEQSVTFAGHLLPTPVGTTTFAPLHALCLGPAEWLVIQPGDATSDVAADGLAIVDVSDGLVSLDVCGPRVREILSAGCGLDLDPQCFSAGRCAHTCLAQIAVTIECLAQQHFQLYALRSYSHYLKDWLTDAAAG